MTSSALNHSPQRNLPSEELLCGLSTVHRRVLVVDDSRRILWMSSLLERSCADARPYIGRDFRTLLPDFELHQADFERLQRAPHCDAVRGQSKLENGDPTLSSVMVSAFGLEESENGPRYNIVALRPVEESCRQNFAPREAADFLASILGSAPDAVIAVDGSGFVIYVNQALEELADRKAKDLLDQPAMSFMRAHGQLDRTLAMLRPDGELDSEELKVRRSDGSVRWVSVSARMIRMPDGRAVGNVCFIRDVTERRRIREKLEQKNAELESYVHSVSHDLRSPLVSLLGFSRLLREDYADLLDETGSHFLERIEQAGRSMEALIQDLLELSRIGRPDEYRTLVDPLPILVQIESELKLRMDDQNTRLVLPQDSALVYCDRTRLYQVLSNLVGNALKHMGPCEGPEIRVEIDAEASGHHIRVSDNGMGIATSDQERIFEIFTSLEQAPGERSGGSTGIGLAIVRKIIETHGGRVWVESSPGRGACFHCTLPYRP